MLELMTVILRRPAKPALEGRRPVSCRLHACCTSSAVHPSRAVQGRGHLRMTGLGEIDDPTPPPPPRRQPEHALPARVMGRHQAVDVARKLRAAALPWRLELRRNIGPLFAPERHQAAAE